jgi:hypothetical protein
MNKQTELNRLNRQEKKLGHGVNVNIFIKYNIL